MNTLAIAQHSQPPSQIKLCRWLFSFLSQTNLILQRCWILLCRGVGSGHQAGNIQQEYTGCLKLHAWRRGGTGKDTLWNDYTLQRFVPFNPTDKYTIAHVKNNKTGECTRIMKGAPQVRSARGAPSSSSLCTTACSGGLIPSTWRSTVQLSLRKPADACRVRHAGQGKRDLHLNDIAVQSSRTREVPGVRCTGLVRGRG